MEFGSLINLQHCLASKASLKSTKLLKPSPPSAFDRPNFSFETQWMCVSPHFCPYQKLKIIASNSLHIVMVNLNKLIRYIRIACTTAFINTSRPTCDKVDYFHLWIFSKSLPFTYANPLFFDRPQIVGTPRYKPGSSIVSMPRMPGNFFDNTAGTLPPKKTLDFCKLTCCPEAEQYASIN